MEIHPNFLIIGAMKSATSSLYDQLTRQPGIFMPTPKEPNFFSDDEIFAKGIEWYNNLFASAKEDDLIGEASTHYTKLPTYPNTVKRISAHLQKPCFIYVMRHPIDRLVSHYIHEWSQGNIDCDINKSLDEFPDLINYSLYSMQLQPYIDTFGSDAVLPVFFDRIKQDPKSELVRICNFIGYRGEPKWFTDLKPGNVSSKRVRRFPFYSLLIESMPATWIRRNFIPKTFRENVRRKLSLQKRPEISAINLERLNGIFNKDLSILGDWLGIELNCDNFSRTTRLQRIEWQKNDNFKSCS